VETSLVKPELTTEQFISTLYGVRTVVHAGEAGKAVSKRCYYARSGPFERWPEIDAALISTLDGYVLCLNEFSPRAEDLRHQEVPKRLAERGAVIVPHEREARGECFVADLDIDRRDEAAVRDHLRGRYNHPELQVVNFKEHSVIVDEEQINLPDAKSRHGGDGG
jgi:hypothetical protein